MTFKELYERFRKERILEVKPSTRALHALAWKMLSPRLEDKDISEFGRLEARILLAEMLESKLAPKTSKDRMAFIRTMLHFAATELEQPVKSMAWGLKYPAGQPRKIKSFTEAEMLRLVKSAENEINGGNANILPALIAILTGMRIGETLALQWGDIDWRHNTINVCRNVVKAYDPELRKDRYFIGSPKTASGYREIPMLPTLRRVLRDIGGDTPDATHFVVGNSDKPKAHNNVRETYSRFLKKYRLPDINFHGLRHTYATLLVESGGDIKTISTLLGHSKVSLTLDLYVHPSVQAKRNVVNKAFRKLKIKESNKPDCLNQNSQHNE